MNLRSRGVAIVAVLVVVLALITAGLVRIGLYVADNIGAPGPAPTGSGPCGPADSVNIQLVFADGHTVQACTRDRPSCTNQTGGGNGAGQGFTLDNQLRSNSRRYILFIRTSAPLQAGTAEQTFQLDGIVGLPGQPAAPPNATGPGAELQVTPRDPLEDGATALSGSLSISSSHGVLKGRIDGGFFSGPSRSDRPQPSPHWSPLRITGTFTCGS